MKELCQIKLILKSSQSIFIIISSWFSQREAGPTVTSLLPSLGPSTRGHADRELLDPSPLQSPSAPLPSLSLSLFLSLSVSLSCARCGDLEANKACFFPQPEIHTAALIRSIRHYIAPLGVPHRHTKMERYRRKNCTTAGI